MQQLNFPSYDFSVRRDGESLQIFDSWRRRFVRLTPEEWVRQHMLRFLVDELGYPSGLLAVEYSIDVNGMRKRCDAVLFDTERRARLIVELKAPHVRLTQRVFDQVAVYNHRLGVDYFILSNGLEHYACRVDRQTGRYLFFPSLPDYSQLVRQS